MPNVTKHTTNNLVTVSYPVREAQLELTLAIYDLILMFRTEKVKMIKFIRSQYNLGLYDAKQVVDTVITSAENKPEVQLQSTSEETEVDWSKVKEGTWILVRDSEDEEWNKGRFVRLSESRIGYPFICNTLDIYDALCWKYAKLIND